MFAQIRGEITNQTPSSGERTESESQTQVFSMKNKSFPEEKSEVTVWWLSSNTEWLSKRKTVEFSSSSQVHRTRIDVWKSQGDWFGDKTGAHRCVVYVLCTGVDWEDKVGAIVSINSLLSSHKDASPVPTTWTAEKGFPITVPQVGTSCHCTLPSFIASGNSILSVVGIQCVHKFFTFLPSKNGTQFYCLPM